MKYKKTAAQMRGGFLNHDFSALGMYVDHAALWHIKIVNTAARQHSGGDTLARAVIHGVFRTGERFCRTDQKRFPSRCVEEENIPVNSLQRERFFHIRKGYDTIFFFRADERIVGIGILCMNGAFNEYIAVSFPEIQKMRKHRSLFLRDIIRTDGDLGNSEKDGQKLGRNLFGRVVLVPHDHIRMHCGFSGGQAQIHRTDAVVNRIVRAVTDPEHIAVFADGGSDVPLTEFDEEIRIDPPKCRCDLGKKRIQCVLQ